MRLPLPDVPGRDGEVDGLETPTSMGCFLLFEPGLTKLLAVVVGLSRRPLCPFDVLRAWLERGLPLTDHPA